MDFSLVLASQAIETIIECIDGKWQLRVSAPSRQAALQAIHCYRVENRRWPWRREVTASGVLFDWSAVVWVSLIGFFHWLSEQKAGFQSWGVMDAQLVSAGEWWRLFTAAWLHGDIAHLASNATLGLVLLGLVLGRYGAGFGVLAASLAGIGGNILSWLLFPGPHRSLGASGFVMGCLGLLAAQTLPHWRLRRSALWAKGSRKPMATRLLSGILLFVLVGLAPGTDIMAHFGGFVTGLLLGWPLAFIPQPNRFGKLNLLAAFLFALLIIVPWWLALRNCV
jgi:membrane associated rhomboid family serine protease